MKLNQHSSKLDATLLSNESRVKKYTCNSDVSKKSGAFYNHLAIPQHSKRTSDDNARQLGIKTKVRVQTLRRDRFDKPCKFHKFIIQLVNVTGATQESSQYLFLPETLLKSSWVIKCFLPFHVLAPGKELQFLVYYRKALLSTLLVVQTRRRI